MTDLGGLGLNFLSLKFYQVFILNLFFFLNKVF